MEQEKRGLCPYDDKRYLLADLPDGTPNPNTHAYGHHELATEAHVEMDIPELTGTDLIIEQRQPPQEIEVDGDQSRSHTRPHSSCQSGAAVQAKEHPRGQAALKAESTRLEWRGDRWR